MADTPRTLAALQEFFKDGEWKNVSAQRLRDFVVSVYNYVGYGTDDVTTAAELKDAVTKKHLESHTAASHSDISSTGTEIDAAITLSKIEHTNALFVAKNGNDANDGKRIDEAKLTIQAAVTAASSGNTVYVFDGDYDETIILKNGVDIVAFNPENTTILRQVTDNNVECNCYLNITINNGYAGELNGLYIRHGSSDIKVTGNITGGDDLFADGGYGIFNESTGIVTVIGDITGGTGDPAGGVGGRAIQNYSTGIVTVTGNITGGTGSAEGYGVYNSTGTIIVKNGTIKNPVNDSASHSIINNGTLTLQDVKILCTHADAKSIYSGTAQNVRCMGVWANRDDHANITQLIPSGFTFDTDVL